jgi:PAS domain S-box-containing protein
MTDIKSSDNSYDLIPFGVILLSDQFLIEYINPAMQQYLDPSGSGYLNGTSIFDTIPESDQDSFRTLLTQTETASFENKMHFCRLNDVKNSPISFMIRINQIQDQINSKNHILVTGLELESTMMNLRSFLELEKNCHQIFREYQYRNIFHNLPIGMAVLDENGIIEETNPTFLQHIGVKDRDVKNKHFTDVVVNPTNEKLNALADILRNNQQKLVKDVVSITEIEDQKMILEVSFSKLFSDCENPEKYLIITEDITYQRDTHFALVQAEKLVLTGRLAASLAHEINNPLQTSLGCLGLIQEMVNEDDDKAVYINMAIDELQRSSRIVKKLRDLNRTTEQPEHKPIDLREIIEGVLILTRNHLIDRNIIPVFSYREEPPIVHASKDQIQQVVLNLMMNAIDELSSGGKIFIEIKRSDDPKGYTLTIRDNGKGIDPDIVQHIFDPFTTTKDAGMGLGLYICKQIIENHSGYLDFNNVPGGGTEFAVWLPVNTE